MAGESRLERPLRRGRVDDTGGDAEEGDKLYYHLTLLAESDKGYKNLLKLSSEAYLSGYWYKPRVRLGPARPVPRGRNRHYGVPRRAGKPGAAARATSNRPPLMPPGCRRYSAGTACLSNCRTTVWKSSARPTRNS